MDLTQFLANELIFKRLHLKHCILYRKTIKKIIHGFNLPENEIETIILNYVGSKQCVTL
jgi:hypothetical protein